ncbi:MAG: hypothetical protein KIT16_01435 [Rhodospirillaceae bacterium]|nr:hypothetical protein [Rhodospirillaceae bacterium]
MTQRNEGEGNKTAAREYNKGAAEHARHPDEVKKAAAAAKRALDGPEGAALREAEIEGKSAARGEDRKLYEKGKPGGTRPDADLG